MKTLQLKLRRTKMCAIITFINLFSVRSASILIICLCIAFSLGCSAEGTISGGTNDFPGGGISEDPALEWVVPEAVGWSSAELEAAQEFAQQSGCTAVMALYDGKVFFSRGNIHKNYEAHSMRMPFLSALYGIHVSRGSINLNATLEDLHIDDIPPGLSHSEKQARVEHLLMSRSGVYHEAATEEPAMIDERPARESHAPDTFFYYNNWDFNALGTIFEQETGEDSEIGQMIGFPGYYHTAADGYVLVVIPDLKLVIVERYDTDQNWEDPEDEAFELGMLIIDAQMAE
jgi:hypothetical protein